MRTEGATHGVAPERKRQPRLLLPPNAQVDHFVQPLGREEELSLVDEQARVDEIILNGVNDLVEGHNHRLKVRLEEFEGEIGRSLQAGNTDALAHKVLCFQRLGGNDNGAVTFAKAGAAIKQDVLVAKSRISSKADGRDVISLSKRGLVQRLDVREDVRVLISRRGELVGGQSVEHEGIIGIRRVR